MQKILFLGFVFIFFANGKLLAQEENYQPIKITDTLNEARSKAEERKEDRVETKKLTKQEEGARTELEKKKALLNRLRVGVGNIGLQFGAVTYVSIAPTIGFVALQDKLKKDRLEVGVGPILIYQRIRYDNGYKQSFFVYGADFYAKGFVYKGLSLQARYDLVNKPSNYNLNSRLNVHHLLFGAGYAQAMGKVGYFNVTAMYNVLNNKESIYRGTFSDKFPLILDFGFSFGLGGKD